MVGTVIFKGHNTRTLSLKRQNIFPQKPLVTYVSDNRLQMVINISMHQHK
jgi:hypothetical protein